MSDSTDSTTAVVLSLVLRDEYVYILQPPLYQGNYICVGIVALQTSKFWHSFCYFSMGLPISPKSGSLHFILMNRCFFQ